MNIQFDKAEALKELGALIAKQVYAKMNEPRVNLHEIAKEVTVRKTIRNRIRAL